MDHLTESEIREVLRTFARRVSAKETNALLVEEVVVGGGRNRIDMVYIGGATIGIEIKSARDDLKRLPEQATSFSQYFDYLILVADEQLIVGATEILPNWWGVLDITRQDGRIKLKWVRKPTRNTSVKTEQLLELLWKKELLSLLGRTQKTDSVQRLRKRDLRKKLVFNADEDELRKWSINAMLSRQNWRGIRLHQPN